ncbi:MAG: hypothetical protein WD266_01265, partial [Balneolales bacterium]
MSKLFWLKLYGPSFINCSDAGKALFEEMVFYRINYKSLAYGDTRFCYYGKKGFILSLFTL